MLDEPQQFTPWFLYTFPRIPAYLNTLSMPA